jgi:hypothetical protein
MLGWESTVAGLHRLLAHRQALAKARVISATAAVLSTALTPKGLNPAFHHSSSCTARRTEAYPFSARSLSSKNDGAVYGWMCSVGLTQHSDPGSSASATRCLG